MLTDSVVLLINGIGIAIATSTLWSGAKTGRLVFPKSSHGGLVTRVDRPLLFWAYMSVQYVALIGCSYFFVDAVTRLVRGVVG